ncbi:guanine nucleotide exchange factor [Tupanvirus soda lake]|uniref:Guanine nucleotide exchange factor n=2 Tax=Tupanvirus TaxID=2094720 RepID=A0A6N1NNP7_9VIRU|nr:guanine nucleotide exchange factor [Tupanvirus soda lake]QKU35949.1 guanine nucleotide exchange factor [Tupanvirus soda lake]
MYFQFFVFVKIEIFYRYMSISMLIYITFFSGNTKMTKIKDFINNIILNGSPQEQIDLMRIYPALKLNKPILNRWFKIFENIKTELRKEVRFDVFLNEHSLLINQEQKAIIFLENGLTAGLIKPDENELSKVTMLLKSKVDSKFMQYVQTLHKSIITPRDENTLDISCGIIPLLKSDRHIPMSLDNISEDNFVDAINNYYIRIFNKINVHEFFSKTFSVGSRPQCLSILFEMFTKFSNMVPNEVLVKNEKKKARIKTIKKFISIANKFLRTHNYEAAFGIIAGLNYRAIQRIKDLWQPHKKYYKSFQYLENIISSEHNYDFYRKLIKNKNKYIPYIGIVLSDLDHCLQIDIVDSNTKEINIDCYNLVVKIINSFVSTIPCRNNITKTNENIINFINNYKYSDEDKLYNISYELFPLQQASPVTPDKKDRILKSYEDESPRPSRFRRLSTKFHSLGRKSNSKISNNKYDSDDLSIGQFTSLMKRLNKKDFVVNGDKYDFVYNTPVRTWSKEQVLDWLKHIELDCYIEIFDEHDITGFSLTELDYDHLKDDLGIIKVGHRIKILKFINMLIY